MRNIASIAILLASLSTGLAQGQNSFEEKSLNVKPLTAEGIAQDRWEDINKIYHADEITQTNEALLKKTLARFEGSWAGTMKLTTMDGANIHQFFVQEEYWWGEDGKIIKGLAAFDDGGVLRYAQSDTYIKDGVLYSNVVEDLEAKLYKAQIVKNVITWLPMRRDMTLDHQVQITFDKTEDGLTVMRNKGYERFERGKTWILLNGDLYLLDGSKEAQDAAEKSKEAISEEEAAGTSDEKEQAAPGEPE